MSTDLVHILTVIGDRAGEIEAACDAFLKERVEQEPRSRGSDDWSDQARAGIDRFCEALVESAQGLPILYYAAYIDGWSAAHHQHFLLEWPDGTTRQMFGDDYGLAYYPSSFREDFLAQIRAARRRRFYRNQSEDRWYLDRVDEAIRAALWLNAPFLVVSVRKTLGPTRHDEDVRKSLEERPSGRSITPFKGPSIRGSGRFEL